MGNYYLDIKNLILIKVNMSMNMIIILKFFSILKIHKNKILMVEKDYLRKILSQKTNLKNILTK